MPIKHGSRYRIRKVRKFFGLLGPGLTTGAADDDPSGIATYSQTGAQFGYGQLWTALYMLPFMTAVQEACARIGLVTGKGIAAVVKEHYSKPVLYAVVGLVVVANTINIGADIDLGMHLFSPIGTTTVFTFSGTFNGNDHTISNLFIVTPQGVFTGFFGQVTNATIKNIKFQNAYIRGKDSSAVLAGGLLGSTATDCHATGINVNGTGPNTGGLIGSLISNSHMLRCSASGAVVGVNQTGGLVGSPWDLATVTESWSAGTVTGTYIVGGIAGYSAFAFGGPRPITINNCYSTSNVTATIERAGGIYGGSSAQLTIKNSYSTGTVTSPTLTGALIGTVGNLTTANDYWDIESSGITNVVGQFDGAVVATNVVSKTTAEMKSETMVALLNSGQDNGPWSIDPSRNNGYPSFSPVLSAPSFTSNLSVVIYPTIVDAEINIETAANISGYTIYSISGKLIASEKLNSTSAQINAAGIAAGIYILQITTDQGKVTRKFVKN